MPFETTMPLQKHRLMWSKKFKKKHKRRYVQVQLLNGLQTIAQSAAVGHLLSFQPSSRMSRKFGKRLLSGRGLRLIKKTLRSVMTFIQRCFEKNDVNFLRTSECSLIF
jgi:hypothetical protein